MSGGRGARDLPLTYHGAFDATVTYSPRQVVTSSGGVFMSTATSTGQYPPTSPASWLTLAGMPVVVGADITSPLTCAALSSSTGPEHEVTYTHVFNDPYPDSVDDLPAWATPPTAGQGIGATEPGMYVVNIDLGYYNTTGLDATFWIPASVSDTHAILTPTAGTDAHRLTVATVLPFVGYDADSAAVIRAATIVRGVSGEVGYTRGILRVTKL